MAIKTIIDENGVRTELADEASIEIRHPVTVRSTLFDSSNQQIGQKGPPGPATPYVDLASTFGMHPTASAAANTAGYWTWMSSSTYNFHTLVLDRQGTYDVRADSIAVPSNRTLRAASALTTIRAMTSGTWTVAPFSSPAFVENLTINANNSTKWGTFTSSSNPPGAGSTMFLKGVSVINALSASIFSFCSYIGLEGVSTSGSPIGILAESCSELLWRDITNSSHADACIRCVGSASPEFGVQHNGGRVVMFKVVQALCNYGLDLVGIGEASVHGITCEGSSIASIRFGRGSTNCHVFGSRTNAGNAVQFSGSLYCDVYGGCVNTQNVVHYGGVANRAYLKSESSNATNDILNVFTSSTGIWHAICRPEGYISLSGSAPTQGVWMAEDKIWRHPAAGQSMGYVAANGGAGPSVTWVSMSNYQ